MRWRPLAASGADRSILPARKLHRPTMVLIAIMTFAMVVIAAAGLALSHAAGTVGASVRSGLVVEIPAGMGGSLQAALEAVRSSPGVQHATAVPEKEMRATLRDWLGNSAFAEDVPVPALVTAQLAPGTDSRRLQRALESRIPGATVVTQAAQLRPLLRSIQALQWLAASLVLLVAIATAAAVILVARGALDTHRPTVEIMHGIGATDRQLTRLFERKIALDAFAGAIAGFAAAVATLLLLAGTFAAAAGAFASALPLAWTDLLLLAAIPLLLVALALLVARWAVMKALRERL